MENPFSRSELMIGAEAMQRLAAARVAVFGLGGVGGSAAEALVRAGIGALDLIDGDKISLTNLNRQLLATHRTVGQFKTDAAAERFLDINPELKLRLHRLFYLPETAAQFDFSEYDYVVDAIDSVTGKIELVMNAQRCGTPIICAMGAGNKRDPAAFEVADLYQTSVCPLARVMRGELRKRGIKALKVVYSKEKPLSVSLTESEQSRRSVPGSLSFVPPAMGLVLAGEVVRELAKLL